jgi:hypothetical protein
MINTCFKKNSQVRIFLICVTEKKLHAYETFRIAISSRRIYTERTRRIGYVINLPLLLESFIAVSDIILSVSSGCCTRSALAAGSVDLRDYKLSLPSSITSRINRHPVSVQRLADLTHTLHIQDETMTPDEQHSILAEKLDNATSRLILASRENDTNTVRKCKIEAKRLLMEYETFISDI